MTHPLLPALLTVRSPNRITISKALYASVQHLCHGAPIEIVPPLRRGGTWYLDTRPTAGRRLSARPGEAARFRSGYRLGPEHFVQPMLLARKGTKGGALGSAGHRAALRFLLEAELPGYPGYYCLRALPGAPAAANGSVQ